MAGRASACQGSCPGALQNLQDFSATLGPRNPASSVWPRGSPFHGSAFRICRISRPRSAPEILQILPARAQALLYPSYLKPCQNPWRPARDVGRRYSRFFGGVILATDGSKCNEGHKFSNRQNPRHHPIRKNRITPHFGQCRKNLSDYLDTGQCCHTLGALIFLEIVLVQGMIPNGQAFRNSAKFLPYNGHQITLSVWPIEAKRAANGRMAKQIE